MQFIPRYVPIKPQVWPQDDLQPPSGYGRMPNPSPENAEIVRNEPFVYGGFLSVPAASTYSLVIPIQADADFWCNQIIALCTVDGNSGGATSGTCQITDIRSGYQFFYPNGQIGIFLSVSYGSGGSTFQRLQGTLIQPYCFTRNGGVRVDINNPNPANVLGFHLAFCGWKEYEYVSR